MRIGELARRTGVSERALRYYEQQGLLTPERRPSGYRVFRDEHVPVVRRVRILLAAGLNTAQIRQAVPCLVDDDDDLLTPGCPELVDGLIRHRDRIDEAIGELEATRGNLDAIITRSKGLEP
jgi:DNA-binding transcriptional MerR regulator